MFIAFVLCSWPPPVLKSLHTAPHPDKDASDAMDRSGAGKMSGRPDKKSASESHQSRSLRASLDRVNDSLDLIRRPSGREFKMI